MKSWIVALAIWLTPVKGYGPERAEFPASLPQVVQVNGGCSGFVGWKDVVVTAAHCIESPDSPQVIRFYDGLLRNDFRVIAIGQVDHTDYALLLGDTRGIEPLPLAKKAVEPETLCRSVGYGGARSSQYAVPCETRPPLLNPLWRRYIALHSNIIGGDSGSMLMDLDTGEVFGIVVRSSYPIPTGLAVDIQHAKKAYKAWLSSSFQTL